MGKIFEWVIWNSCWLFKFRGGSNYWDLNILYWDHESKKKRTGMKIFEWFSQTKSKSS